MVVYSFILNMNIANQRGEQQFSSGLYCRTQNSMQFLLSNKQVITVQVEEFFDNEEEMAKFQKWREEYEEKERLEKEDKAKKKAGEA